MTPRAGRRGVMSESRGVVVPVFLVLALLATGCVAPGSEVEPQGADLQVGSLPRFDYNATLVERLALPLPDGVDLDVAVFRPDVEKAGAADERVPILVDAGPYFGNLAGPMMEMTGFDERLAEYFIPRGYAVARVSLRGTGMSEGCFRVGDAQEREDLREAVEFLASQPWSNGAVALIGKSYDGTTPWMAALADPPSLRTIVPISGITDMYRYTFQDGVAYPESTGFHTYYPLLVDYDVDLDVPPSYTPLSHAQPNLVRTCAGIVPDSLDAGRTYADGDHGTPFWQDRDYEPHVGDVKVPVFLVHGLQDWNVKPDNGVPVYDRLNVPKAMWLGQWEHDYPDINRFKEEWSRHDWNQTLLTWFDHWLKDVENDWQKIAHVEVQDSAGTWSTYASWPPADADKLTLHLAPDGTLRAAPADEGEIALRDPLALGHRGGETGETGASFVTGPMPRNVTLLGMPTADLHLTIDQPGGHLVVGLWLVSPDGEWTSFEKAARSVRHRESRDQGSDAPRGEAFNMTVNLYAQQTVVPAGHRLGVTVSPNAPERYAENPFRLATYRLLLGGEHATTLTLQLEPGDGTALASAATSAEPVPMSTRCFPTCPTSVSTEREIIK